MCYGASSVLQAARRNSRFGPEAWLFLNPPYLLAPIISCDLRPYIHAEKTCVRVCVSVCVYSLMCERIYAQKSLLYKGDSRDKHTNNIPSM